MGLLDSYVDTWCLRVMVLRSHRSRYSNFLHLSFYSFQQDGVYFFVSSFQNMMLFLFTTDSCVLYSMNCGGGWVFVAHLNHTTGRRFGADLCRSGRSPWLYASACGERSQHSSQKQCTRYNFPIFDALRFWILEVNFLSMFGHNACILRSCAHCYRHCAFDFVWLSPMKSLQTQAGKIALDYAPDSAEERADWIALLAPK